MEDDQTVSVDVPVADVTTEVQEQTQEMAGTAAADASVALGLALNAGEVAATASDDVQELEVTWQETALQIGTAIAGLQSTCLAQTTLLQSLTEQNSNLSISLATRDALITELLTRLALAVEAQQPHQTEPPPSAVEDAPREAEANPAETAPAENPVPRLRRRIL